MFCRHSSERGQALILGILVITVVLGMTATAVDVGLAFSKKAKLQSGVDAAALAGAQLLPDDPAAAQAAAEQIAAANGIDAGRLEIEIFTTSYPSDTIRVRATDSSVSYFARALQIAGFNMRAKAAARAGSPAGMSQFIPLAVEQSVFNTLNSGDTATLKYDAQNQTNGNSLALALPGASTNCSGANSTGACRFRNNIATGTTGNFCVYGQEYGSCTSSVNTEPGQMIGPLQQGLDRRFQATSSSCDEFAEVVATDPTNPDELVLSQSCHPFQPYNVTGSKRVVIVPVIDQLCNGSCTVKIVQFAVFYVNNVQCTTGSGQGGGGGGSGSGGPGQCTVTGVYAERVSNVRNYTVLGAFNPNAGFTFGALVE